MRSRFLSLVVGATMVACLCSPVRALEPLRPAISVAAWRADLRFFAAYVTGRNPAPYAHVSAAEFDAAVSDFDRQIPSLDTNHIILRFQRILAMLADGHTTLPLFFDGQARVATSLGFHQYPIQITHFHQNISYAVVPSANHEMMILSRDPMSTDEQTLQTMAPDAPTYFVLLGSWLTQHVLDRH
jgi:hypothetical protein